jgi:hypothetical protein
MAYVYGGPCPVQTKTSFIICAKREIGQNSENYVFVFDKKRRESPPKISAFSKVFTKFTQILLFNEKFIANNLFISIFVKK